MQILTTLRLCTTLSEYCKRKEESPALFLSSSQHIRKWDFAIHNPQRKEQAMKILVVGNGGREHALVHKLHQSPLVQKIYCAPGNVGTAEHATTVPIGTWDVDALCIFAKDNGIDLTVVGPETAIAEGIGDVFREAGLAIVAPTSAAARIETSKAEAVLLMRRLNIPHPTSWIFNDLSRVQNFVRDHLQKCASPIVIKASRLMQGKGVVLTDNSEVALKTLAAFLDKEGRRVVVQEFLQGEEVSCMFLVDPEGSVEPLMPARDYKRASGSVFALNTGGMGAIAGENLLTPPQRAAIRDCIVAPLLKGMRQEGRPFCGVLYVGIMLTADGPKVLEFNVRLGDPETQVILPLLQSDLAKLLLATATGGLGSKSVRWSFQHTVGITIASEGYPGGLQVRLPVDTDALYDLRENKRVQIFHARTMIDDEGLMFTAGGRIFTVVGIGENRAEARALAYGAAADVLGTLPAGPWFRDDIAADAPPA